MPILEDPRSAVRQALKRPVGCRPLAEEVRGKRRVCILLCDITRPVPNGWVLPELLEELLQRGMRPEQITLMVATGLHRPNQGKELLELVGGDEAILNTFRIFNHDARDDEMHVELGTTPRGTRVLLDRRFVEADLRIVVGLVEPHFMAGYSGGRKIITPGVAHKETITHLHTARFLEDPASANCVLEGNPLHEEQVHVVKMLGGALAINTVLDENRRLAFVNFGEVVQSHLAAVEFMRPYAEVPVHRRFRTVVTTSAGYPLDRTYYQTVKGMVSPLDILVPGGDLFIVSRCDEGMGSPEYIDAQRRLVQLGPDGFMEELYPKQYALVDEWQTEMQVKAMRRGKIHLYTEGLTPEERRLTGVNVIESLQEALAKAVEERGDGRLAVIPEGPYVIPVYRP
jgi:nickel-dependent lactate racemase